MTLHDVKPFGRMANSMGVDGGWSLTTTTAMGNWSIIDRLIHPLTARLSQDSRASHFLPTAHSPALCVRLVHHAAEGSRALLPMESVPIPRVSRDPGGNALCRSSQPQ